MNEGSIRRFPGRFGSETVVSALLMIWVLVAATGCGSGGNTSSGVSGSVTFGAIEELSGPYQAFGQPATQVFATIAKELNPQGILVGGKRYTFKYQLLDDRSDPAAVPTQARQLLAANPVAIIGPFVNGPSAYQILKGPSSLYMAIDYGIQSQLEGSPTADPLLFTPVSFYDESVPSYVSHIHIYAPDIKTVAILTSDDATGHGGVDFLTKNIAASGMSLVSALYYPSNTADYAPFLTAIKAKHPDLLIAYVSHDADLNITRQAASLEVAKYIFPDNVLPGEVVTMPETANAVVLVPTWNPTYGPYATLPIGQPQKIFADGPTLSPQTAVVYYYAVEMVIQAMQKAGTVTDATAIATALTGLTWNGPMGPCTMSARHALDCSAPMFVVDHHKVTAYDYESLGATKPRGVYQCDAQACVKVSG